MAGYVTIDPVTGKNAWWDGQRVVPMTPALQRQWDSRFLSDQDSGAPDAMAERQQFSMAAKKLSDEAAAYRKIATPRRADLQGFLSNNIDTNTGNIFYQLPLGAGDAIARMGGEKAANMAAIGSNLQLANAPQGQGAITDFERGMVAMGSPSVKNQGNVNANLVHRQIGYLNEQGDRIGFMQKYLQTNGHLNGADEAWQGYVQVHPYVVNDNKSGSAKYVDPKTRQAWDDYFGLRQAAPARPTMAPRAQGGATGGQRQAQSQPLSTFKTAPQTRR